MDGLLLIKSSIALRRIPEPFDDSLNNNTSSLKCFSHRSCIPVPDFHLPCKRSASSEYPYRTSLHPRILNAFEMSGFICIVSYFNEFNFSALLTSTSIHESHSRKASCSRRTCFLIIREINEWNPVYDSSERSASNDLR